MKRKTDEEKSELSTKCVQLKMKSSKDEKNYLTDILDTKGILRLIESVPSPKAEPLKVFLAKVGSERIDEVFDPELSIKRGLIIIVEKEILDRFKLTDVWKEGGIKKRVVAHLINY